MLVEGLDYKADDVDYDAEFRQLLADTYDSADSKRRGPDAWLWDYLDAMFDVAARARGIVVLDCEIHEAMRYHEAHGESEAPPLYRYVFDACEGFLTASKIWSVHLSQWLERHPDPLPEVHCPARLGTFLCDERERVARESLDRLRPLWKGDHVLRRVLAGQTSVALRAPESLPELVSCDLSDMTCTGGDSGTDFPRLRERFLQPPEEGTSIGRWWVSAVFDDDPKSRMLYRLTLGHTHHVLVVNGRWQIRVRVVLEPSSVQDLGGQQVAYGPPSDDAKVEVEVVDTLPPAPAVAGA